MFEGLSVNNSNNLAPSLTSNNGTNLTPLFDAMSIQPPTTLNQPLNTDDDDDRLVLSIRATCLILKVIIYGQQNWITVRIL